MINKIFRPKILHRNRVNKILSQIFDVTLFFISASMGYGKSTSVRNFLEHNKEIKVIWFDIASEDHDDSWMWYKFCNSLKSINPRLSEKLNNYGFPGNNMDAYKIIDIIRNELKQRTVIVINQWHGKDVYINYLIKAIAIEEIPNLHIIIMSSFRPSDEYIELELKRKCIIMWQEDLAFTFDETMEFFNINGINELTDNEKKEVYEYTGGWALGNYLALLQYYNKRTFENIPKAAKFIKTVVYDKFDAATKQILLKLALVDRFTLDQASYITENKECGVVIKELISNNCFIKYDEESKVYTLHSILKNVLEEEILCSNIDLNKVNNACGDWYSQNNEDMYAMQYYYKARNFERIIDLIERNYTIDLTSLRKTIINSVFNQLSMEEKINSPIAYLTYIFFYIIYENALVGKKLLYEVKDVYESDKNLKDKNQILGEIAFLESLLMFSDVKKMTEHHKKAYNLFNGGASKIANDKMPVTFGSPHFICLYHRKKGNLKDMIESFEQDVSYFVHISNGGGTGLNYLMRAEYYFETGDSVNGELFAYKALHKAKLKNQTSVIICSLFLLMRICVNNNNVSKARNTFNSLIKEYENFNVPSFLNGVGIAIAYINGITGNLEELSKWIENSEKANLPSILPVTIIGQVAMGLAMILEDNYIKLEIHAEAMLEEYEIQDNIFGILYAYMFEAIAKYKIYDIDRAKKSLLKAIDLAKDDHLIMCFVELAPHILPILKNIGGEDEYLITLLSTCEKFNEIYMRNYNNEKIELTPREIEVMKLVDEGYKQSEISERLNIALITVKKHIAAVYMKLDVKNKTIALNILKQRGII